MRLQPYSGGRLDVTADLTLTVDGVTTTVTGSGSELRVETADPAGLLDSIVQAELPAGVGRVDGARALGRLAELLAQAGVRVTVAGPRGDVLVLGDVSPAWTGRLVTGSRRVRLGAWAAVRPLVAASVRQELRRRRTAGITSAAALAAAGAVAVELLRRRRRTTGS